MRLMLIVFSSLFAIVFAASHSAPPRPVANFTMPKQAAPAMDADDGELPAARYIATDADPLDSRDWLNDHAAQANILYACDLIGQGEYSADRVEDGIRRQRIGAVSPEALTADREFVAAEMATLRLHSCRELSAMPFAGSWRPLGR